MREFPLTLALAAQVPGCSKGVRDPGVLGSCTSGRGEYLPFITDGFVSLVGGGVQVPVKILRDTGASETFVLQSVFPFSPVSDTGTRILVCGIGLNTFAVPLHRLVLQWDLVQGEVVVGVRPSLPVEGVSVILGNNLAGARVWGDAPPSLVVCPEPALSETPDHCERCFPEVFSACVVTRSMSCAVSPEDVTPEVVASSSASVPLFVWSGCSF